MNRIIYSEWIANILYKVEHKHQPSLLWKSVRCSGNECWYENRKRKPLTKGSRSVTGKKVHLKSKFIYPSIPLNEIENNEQNPNDFKNISLVDSCIFVAAFYSHFLSIYLFNFITLPLIEFEKWKKLFYGKNNEHSQK